MNNSLFSGLALVCLLGAGCKEEKGCDKKTEQKTELRNFTGPTIITNMQQSGIDDYSFNWNIDVTNACSQGMLDNAFSISVKEEYDSVITFVRFSAKLAMGSDFVYKFYPHQKTSIAGGYNYAASREEPMCTSCPPNTSLALSTRVEIEVARSQPDPASVVANAVTIVSMKTTYTGY